MNFNFGNMDNRLPMSETYQVSFTRNYGNSMNRSSSTGALTNGRPMQFSMSPMNAGALPPFPQTPTRSNPSFQLPPLQQNKQNKIPGAPAYTGTKKSAVSLGVIRLDYDYPPAPGDIDCPDTWDYDVYYRVVPGLTFSMCQSGVLTPRVKQEFNEAIQYLEAKGVNGITGDCGFMMYLQSMARQATRGSTPVFMSALAQLPAVTCAYAKDEMIMIMTANGKTLAPMRDLIKDECGVDPEEKRFIIVGCEDVPGFEAVAAGGKVDVEKVTPGMVAKAKDTLRRYPAIRAILLECTELPPYADALRAALGIPVYDAITCCDFFMTGMKDNARFGINNWQESWDGQQEAYKFGQNLGAEDRALLVNKAR